jgi:putative ABC transport system substrate-binding protein
MLRPVLSSLLFGFAVLAQCQAPTPAKTPRIGFVAPQGRSLPLFDAFRQGLAEHGYSEGHNVVIEPRFAEGQYDRFPAIFRELESDKVDIVAVTGAVTARAAKNAVTDTPIVFSVVVDPVADNVVSNMDHPGANLTGVTSFDPQQATKQFQLLKEVAPTVKRVAILGDAGVSEALINAAQEQAQAMGLQPQPIRVTGPNPDLDAAFNAMRQQHADAVLVLEEPVLGVHAAKVAELAAKDRLPSIFAPSRASAGGLLFYGVSQTEAIRHMTAYVDKILKGARPGDLAVEKVDRYELIVNQQTAHTIGITIPAAVLKLADRVIQ